jgi:carnitine O-acetyltransferase
VLIQVHRSANERPAPFVDHLGILRDSKTGRPINGYLLDEGEEMEEFAMREYFFPPPLVLLQVIDWYDLGLAGYSFFGSEDLELLGRRKKSAHSDVGQCLTFRRSFFLAHGTMVHTGKVIPLAEY